ncbi:MAG: V-type ATPase subunit [Lentisphaeria bacterium]|nr:V-type ATPase subunit [Lentisphaeria bacterium]
MPSKSVNLGTDFLFSKLHGRYSTALVGPRITELIRGGSVQALGRALSGLGVSIQSRADVQKNLTLAVIREIGWLAGLVDEKTASYYRRLLDQYFLENLKTLLRFRYQRGAVEDLSFLLVQSDYLPDIPWDRMTQARTLHEFYSLIPDTGYRRDLLPILVEVDATRDIFVADAKIDCLYFDRLAVSADHLPRAERALAHELTGMEVDIRNILTAARNITVYHFSAEALGSLFLAGGRVVTKERAIDLAGLDTEDTFWTRLPKEYAAVVEPWLRGEPYQVENALWSALFRKADKSFKDFSRPALSAVAYPFLKRFEFLNIARLFEGLYLKLEPELIRSMMVM